MAGAIGGAALSIAVALLMDVLYADILNGTWRDAIALDLSRLTGSSLTPDSSVVILAFVGILAVLGLIGAGLGSVFAGVLYRFLHFLGRHDEP